MFKNFIIFFILSSSLYSARRSTTPSGLPLWWRSLINLSYSINLFDNSWPNADSTLETSQQFQDAIEKSFQVWEKTGHVSFRRSSNSYVDPNNSTKCGCTDIENNSICIEMGCSWVGNNCTGDVPLFDCCLKYDSRFTCHEDPACYWINGLGCFGDCQAPEGTNLISNVKVNWLALDGVIAHTVIWYYVYDGEIIDVDLLINNQNWNFDMRDNVLASFNLQAILVHEIGHMLGIAHPCSIDQTTEPWTHCDHTGGIFDENTMYPIVEPEDDAKLISLEQNDLLALNMVCNDSRILCLSDDFYGEVKVKQGFGCMGTVDINKHNQNNLPELLLLVIPIFFAFLFKRRAKKNIQSVTT